MHTIYRKLRKLLSGILLWINPEGFKKLKYKQQITGSVNDSGLTIEPELFLVGKLIDSQSVVFDIGSNIGEYLYAFEKVAQPGNIYGFEPNQNLFGKLKKMFKKVNLSNIAFSDVSEKAELKIPIINNVLYEARGTLNLEFKEIGENDYTLVDIKKERLDDFVRENKISKIDFIKIDVEGHEFNILKGAANTLRKFKPTLLIEIEQRHHEFPISQIDDFMEGLGYAKFFFNKKEKRISRGEKFNIMEYQDVKNLKSINYINNFFFIDSQKLKDKKFETFLGLSGATLVIQD